MKFLLLPENNSLSHIAKCLTIMDLLQLNGHEAQIAVSQKHSRFLNQLGIKHHIVPDIQETDSGGFPSFKWFSNPEIIAGCIREEVALINRIQPDRVLGVFRFTLYASARLAGVPYDSLICGCMIPDSREVLGFADQEAGSALQKQLLDNFFRFAGKKLSLALRKLELDVVDDIRAALKGERTFLWDFPEFMPIPKAAGVIHAGPISLRHWPYDSIDLDGILDSPAPIAVVSFGTCVTNNAAVLRIIDLLLDLNYRVIVAAGGQSEMLGIKRPDSRVAILNFAPLYQIFPHASLLVTHGGQMTVFEALENEVPVVVMPLQPEQAHNGVCLERIGCGARLIPSTLFSGIPDDYIRAFDQQSDDEIKTKIEALVNRPATKGNLSAIKEAIGRYQGAKTLANLLEVN